MGKRVNELLGEQKEQQTENEMGDLELAIKTAAEKAVLKFLNDGAWLMPDYNNRIKVPESFMKDVWGLVDLSGVQKNLAKRLEEELADRIVNHIASELATDIKQLLSVKERREELRGIARGYIDGLTSKGLTL